MPEDARVRSDGEIEALLLELARLPVDGGLHLAPPPSVGPRFVVHRRLGSGAFGVVYLARDEAAGLDVALKALPVGRAELLYRLKREFRALADLRHPNLVAFHELFADDERCFLTMEYVPGRTFIEHVRPAGRLDVRRLRAGLIQLASGLSALHAAGKLHRDVKPSNVLVTPEARVVLLDFGLVTDLDERGVGLSREVAGTPDYMSPELTRGDPTTAASDWYSVGALLFEALTGRPPTRRRVPCDPSEELPGDLPRDLTELCRALLSPDPGRRPGGAEVNVVLGSAALEGMALPVTAHEPMVGRERELDTLHEALRAVRAGKGRTVLVQGTSGVGKTALVRRFLATAEEEGALVLRGRCYEGERVPYEGIDSLVDELCRWLLGLEPLAAEALLPRHVAALVRLFPVLERVPCVSAAVRHRPETGDEHDLRRHAFGALRELLARLADRRHLVLHIDDLQWGDLDTGALLTEVSRPPDAPVLLLVLTCRSEDAERNPCLKALARGALGDTVQLCVGPLGSAAAESLARRLVPGLGAEDAQRLAADSGGNPFFIHELARVVARRGGLGQPVDLSLSLRARIEELPGPARALLDAVAVAGRPVVAPLVERAVGSPARPEASWECLRAERLVRMSGWGQQRRVEPLHDRIREAVLSALAPSRALEAHRGLIRALEESGGADPEALAKHHAAVGQTDRASEIAELAAAQAVQALAFDRAARLYGWALDLRGAPDGASQRLLTALAVALASAGRGPEAARAYLEAAERAGPGERGDLRRKAAEQLLFSGRIDEGGSLASEDLRAEGLRLPATPRGAVASLVLRRALLRIRGLGFAGRARESIPPDQLALIDHLWAVTRGLGMVETVRAADLAARYLMMALASGEPRLVAQGVLLQACYVGGEAPRSRRARALIERLDRFATELRDPAIQGYAQVARGYRAFLGGEWREARTACTAAEEIFRERCAGVAWEIWTMRYYAVWSSFYLGDFGSVRRQVEPLLEDARERGNVYAMAGLRAPFGVVSWLARDDVQGARQQIRESIDGWSVRGFQLQHYWFLMAESFIDLYAGAGRSAWDRMRDRWAALERSLLLRFPSVRVQMLHLRACCALEAAARAPVRADRQRLRADASRTIRRLERVKLHFARPLADLLRAAHAAQDGRIDEAEARLRAAIGRLDELQMKGYAAAARHRLARLTSTRAAAWTGDEVEDPDATARMLAPGFPER